ncbi:MAG: type II toxin-antitoxin system MqsR family toxin [Thermodesulfobacteriota bacterium]
MEKRKPHYDLKTIKRLFNAVSTRIIRQTAQKNAATIGYMNEVDLLSVVNRLCSDYFYKSMTSYGNHKIWQDVYRYRDENDIPLYIKVQLSPDGKNAVLIQLKRDEGSEE